MYLTLLFLLHLFVQALLDSSGGPFTFSSSSSSNCNSNTGIASSSSSSSALGDAQQPKDDARAPRL
jgi:mevalonate pyrophosphate decarboxylase